MQARIFGFLPAGGSGDFNVDLLQVKVRVIVVLRNTRQVIVSFSDSCTSFELKLRLLGIY
jgi:hypothetical protein